MSEAEIEVRRELKKLMKKGRKMTPAERQQFQQQNRLLYELKKSRDDSVKKWRAITGSGDAEKELELSKQPPGLIRDLKDSLGEFLSLHRYPMEQDHPMYEQYIRLQLEIAELESLLEQDEETGQEGARQQESNVNNPREGGAGSVVDQAGELQNREGDRDGSKQEEDAKKSEEKDDTDLAEAQPEEIRDDDVNGSDDDEDSTSTGLVTQFSDINYKKDRHV